MRIVLEWDGDTFDVDLSSVTPKEFRTIKSRLGLKAGAFIRSFSDLDELDTDAIVAVLWLAEKRGGDPNPPFRDDVPWMDLLGAVKEVQGDEEPEPPKAGDDTPTSS